MNTLIGIEIGGTKLQLVAGDGAGGIIDRQRLEVDKSRGGAGIREQIAQGLPRLIANYQPTAIGVGFGGPVDHGTGRIAKSHQIEGWSEFELGEWLHEQTGLPVRVDNDANVAAFGEALAGAGRETNPVFYVTLGSGVGGGLVVDGRIYHGAKPGESELGHVRLDRSGTLVEERCAGWAVDRQIREAVAGEPGSKLRQLIGSETRGEARFLAGAVEAGDPLATRLLESTAEDLAFGLSHVTQLMHPATIILGGGLSLVGEPLRAAVGRHLRRFIMEVFGEGPEVRLAALGEDAVPVGALLLAAG
ncbi:MAG TPA: sugar kinase [Verrucomicrobiales bacterium]|nr:sugar kinase [Verrucomicrobiales bacterium]